MHYIKYIIYDTTTHSLDKLEFDCDVRVRYFCNLDDRRFLIGPFIRNFRSKNHALKIEILVLHEYFTFIPLRKGTFFCK